MQVKQEEVLETVARPVIQAPCPCSPWQSLSHRVQLITRNAATGHPWP